MRGKNKQKLLNFIYFFKGEHRITFTYLKSNLGRMLKMYKPFPFGLTSVGTCFVK